MTPPTDRRLVARSYDLLGELVEGEVVVRLARAEWERLEAAERERDEARGLPVLMSSEEAGVSETNQGNFDRRWGGLEEPERHLVHHALRMLAKHPLSGEDGPAATRLADELWNEHVRRIASNRA